MQAMWEYGHCISFDLRMTQTRIVHTGETVPIHQVSISEKYKKMPSFN